MSIENIRKLKELAKLPKTNKRKPIARKSAKKLQQESEAKELAKEAVKFNVEKGSVDQEQWFEDRMVENLPICMNCGMEAQWLLQPEYKKIWRACQAHILPKRKTMFPSIATHPLNHMVLFPVWGGHLCGCHDFYDSNWYNATTMEIWPFAVERFKSFEKDISKTEVRKIPEQFIKHEANKNETM